MAIKWYIVVAHFTSVKYPESSLPNQQHTIFWYFVDNTSFHDARSAIFSIFQSDCWSLRHSPIKHWSKNEWGLYHRAISRMMNQTSNIFNQSAEDNNPKKHQPGRKKTQTIFGFNFQTWNYRCWIYRYLIKKSRLFPRNFTANAV